MLLNSLIARVRETDRWSPASVDLFIGMVCVRVSETVSLSSVLLRKGVIKMWWFYREFCDLTREKWSLEYCAIIWILANILEYEDHLEFITERLAFYEPPYVTSFLYCIAFRWPIANCSLHCPGNNTGSSTEWSFTVWRRCVSLLNNTTDRPGGEERNANLQSFLPPLNSRTVPFADR